MRDLLAFHVVFASRSDARDCLEDVAIRLGWTAAGPPLGRRYSRPDAAAEVAPELATEDGWSGLSVELAQASIESLGWQDVEDLLIGWCVALEAALGRSVGPLGFPRLEPWELSGGVDALDTLQWFGSALATFHGLAEKKERAWFRRRDARGGFWLRLVDDPLADPSEPAERAASSLSLGLRPRPEEVTSAVNAVKRARGARAPMLQEDGPSCLSKLEALLGSTEREQLNRVMERASEAGARDRVARHLLSCAGRYGVKATSEALPVVSEAAIELLSSGPEDAVETAVRVLAWRDPEETALQSAVALERWLENAKDAPGVFQFVLEEDDADVVSGMVSLELMGVDMCPCERCADRRRRLAAGSGETDS